jgi:hypothetical protein
MNYKNTNMKNSTNAVLAVMLLVSTVSQVKAQDMDSSLTATYRSFVSAVTMGDLMAGNNKFNLIAAKWPDQWAANYYAAYSNAFISTKEADVRRKDQLLDMADDYVAKMTSQNGGSDESMVLMAYVAYARYLVDPASRWKKYLDLMNSNLDKARKANPDNPRIYYLEGVPLFYRPKLYGGGKGKAKPYFEKAKELFAKQESGDITKPYWGEQENADYLAKCSE